jgi:hypothetical protein
VNSLNLFSPTSRSSIGRYFGLVALAVEKGIGVAFFVDVENIASVYI